MIGMPRMLFFETSRYFSDNSTFIPLSYVVPIFLDCFPVTTFSSAQAPPAFCKSYDRAENADKKEKDRRRISL